MMRGSGSSVKNCLRQPKSETEASGLSHARHSLIKWQLPPFTMAMGMFPTQHCQHGSRFTWPLQALHYKMEIIIHRMPKNDKHFEMRNAL